MIISLFLTTRLDLTLLLFTRQDSFNGTLGMS